MIRPSLLSLALIAGLSGVAAAQRPAAPLVHYSDPCAVYARPMIRAPAAEPTVPPRVVASPATPGRIPSTVIRDYAPNSHAFPSSEPIPVPPRQKPEVQEFRSGIEPSSSGQPRYYDSYPVVTEDRPVIPAAQHGGRSVRFWNLSDRRLTLELGDATYTLERGQPLALDLPASFHWRIAGRGLESTELEASAGMEIVIRR